jgi:hypothetical protein
MFRKCISLYKDFRYKLARSKSESDFFNLSLFIKIWFFDKILKKQPLDASLPWMPYNSIFALDSIIKKDFNILETGSGGSTFFFLKRCKTLLTLEHDSKWIEKLKLPKVISNRKKGWKLIHRNLKSDSASRNSPYLDFLKSLDDEYFDMISIDGRLRNESLIIAIKKVKDGGFILLDNSDRKEYAIGIDLLNKSKFTKRTFSGLCYSLAWDSQSTLWQKI